MLLQLRDFLKREKLASNQQMARTFHLDMSALEPMLEMLVRKGEFHYAAAPSSCKRRCVKCSPGTVVYYTYTHSR